MTVKLSVVHAESPITRFVANRCIEARVCILGTGTTLDAPPSCTRVLDRSGKKRKSNVIAVTIKETTN